MRLHLQTTALPNGVRVTTSAMPHATGVTIGLWVKVGGRHEPARLNGVSHFIEHLLFKGTRRRTARQISEAIEGRGGYLDAYTQEELTCFYARVTEQHTDEVFAVLADMLLHPTFSPRDIAREREVILEEIAMYRDQPSQLVDELLMTALWPDHALGRPLTGTEESLSGMTRTAISGFKSSHYVPGNLVVAMAGAVDHGAAVALAKTWFGRMPCGSAPKAEPVTEAAGPAAFALEKRAIDQTHLAFGFRVFGRFDERKYALKLLSVLLGENMSSRLFQIVREEHGLAYAISSGMQLFDETGLFTIDGGLDVERTPAALELIFRELGRLRRSPPSAKELRKAKDYSIGQLRLGLETTTHQMSWGAEQLVSYGDILQPEAVVRRIEAVTAGQIRDVARAAFAPDRSSCAIISPLAPPRLERLLSRLKARHL